MNVAITPALLEGTLRVPASKSMAHRMLICAALAEGTSVIHGVRWRQRLAWKPLFWGGDGCPSVR